MIADILPHDAVTRYDTSVPLHVTKIAAVSLNTYIVSEH